MSSTHESSLGSTSRSSRTALARRRSRHSSKRGRARPRCRLGPSTLSRLLSTAVLLASCLGTVLTRAETGEHLILEIGPEAARVVDARLTRRLVALETADVEVPTPKGAFGTSTLYYRVLTDPQGGLRVELWELGELHGARRISAEGSEQLEARRIAIAAGELARQLRRRRLMEIEASRRPKASDHKTEIATAGFPIHGALLWSAGVLGGTVAGSAAVLAGPELAMALRFSGRQTVALGAAWLAGDSSRLEGSSLRWLEGNLSASQGFALSPSVDLHVGAGMAAASVHAATTDDWSARAGLEVRAEVALGKHLSLAIGPDVGALLHAVRDGSGHRLMGVWLGAGAGLHLLP